MPSYQIVFEDGQTGYWSFPSAGWVKLSAWLFREDSSKNYGMIVDRNMIELVYRDEQYIRPRLIRRGKAAPGY